MCPRDMRTGKPHLRFSALKTMEPDRTQEVSCSNGKNYEDAKNGRPARRLLGTLLNWQV